MGRLDDVCPTCGVGLDKRPQRMSACPHCQAVIYSRTRPIDGLKVLLSESQAAVIEADWALDYKIKAAQPKALDPVWVERVRLARTTASDPDPKVERFARFVYGEIRQKVLAGESYQDALTSCLAAIPDATLREKVDIRVWQLSVQTLHGSIHSL